MRFASVFIVFVAALCQAVFAIPDGFVGLARLTPYNVSRNSTHELQMSQTTPITTPAGSGRAELQKRVVAIKGRSAAQIQHGNELAGKRVEWFGGAIWCTVSMKQSCWTGYPASDVSEVPMRRIMESNNSVDSVKTVSPRAESHSPFAVDFACSLLSGFQVSNNCWKDDVKSKPKDQVSTTSAPTLPTPTSAADATATHSQPTKRRVSTASNSAPAPLKPLSKRKNIFKEDWCRRMTVKGYCGKNPLDQPGKSVASPTNWNTTTTPPPNTGKKAHKVEVIGGFQQYSA